MWIEKGDFTIPRLPDLEGLNLSVVDRLEQVIQEYPRGDYLNSERCFEEEDDHWTAIARSLSQQQLDELEARKELLRAIASGLREFRIKAEPTYYTKNERHNYLERRAKEGFNRWQAKEEAHKGCWFLQSLICISLHSIANRSSVSGEILSRLAKPLIPSSIPSRAA